MSKVTRPRRRGAPLPQPEGSLPPEPSKPPIRFSVPDRLGDDVIDQTRRLWVWRLRRLSGLPPQGRQSRDQIRKSFAEMLLPAVRVRRVQLDGELARQAARLARDVTDDVTDDVDRIGPPGMRYKPGPKSRRTKWTARPRPVLVPPSVTPPHDTTATPNVTMDTSPPSESGGSSVKQTNTMVTHPVRKRGRRKKNSSLPVPINKTSVDKSGSELDISSDRLSSSGSVLDKTDDSDVATSSGSVTERKRGRPRKKPPVEGAVISTPQGQSPASGAAGRRPTRLTRDNARDSVRHTDAQETAEPEVSPSVPELSSPKVTVLKKRGRPRRDGQTASVISTVSSPSTGSSPTADSQSSKTSIHTRQLNSKKIDVTTIVPLLEKFAKTRGRKPKSVALSDSDDVTQDTPETAVTVPPRVTRRSDVTHDVPDPKPVVTSRVTRRGRALSPKDDSDGTVKSVSDSGDSPQVKHSTVGSQSKEELAPKKAKGRPKKAASAMGVQSATPVRHSKTEEEPASGKKETDSAQSAGNDSASCGTSTGNDVTSRDTSTEADADVIEIADSEDDSVSAQAKSSPKQSIVYRPMQEQPSTVLVLQADGTLSAPQEPTPLVPSSVKHKKQPVKTHTTEKRFVKKGVKPHTAVKMIKKTVKVLKGKKYKVNVRSSAPSSAKILNQASSFEPGEVSWDYSEPVHESEAKTHKEAKEEVGPKVPVIDSSDVTSKLPKAVRNKNVLVTRSAEATKEFKITRSTVVRKEPESTEKTKSKEISLQHKTTRSTVVGKDVEAPKSTTNADVSTESGDISLEGAASDTTSGDEVIYLKTTEPGEVRWEDTSSPSGSQGVTKQETRAGEKVEPLSKVQTIDTKELVSEPVPLVDTEPVEDVEPVKESESVRKAEPPCATESEPVREVETEEETSDMEEIEIHIENRSGSSEDLEIVNETEPGEVEWTAPVSHSTPAVQATTRLDVQPQTPLSARAVEEPSKPVSVQTSTSPILVLSIESSPKSDPGEPEEDPGEVSREPGEVSWEGETASEESGEVRWTESPAIVIADTPPRKSPETTDPGDCKVATSPAGKVRKDASPAVADPGASVPAIVLDSSVDSRDTDREERPGGEESDVSRRSLELPTLTVAGTSPTPGSSDALGESPAPPCLSPAVEIIDLDDSSSYTSAPEEKESPVAKVTAKTASIKQNECLIVLETEKEKTASPNSDKSEQIPDTSSKVTEYVPDPEPADLSTDSSELAPPPSLQPSTTDANVTPETIVTSEAKMTPKARVTSDTVSSSSGSPPASLKLRSAPSLRGRSGPRGRGRPRVLAPTPGSSVPDGSARPSRRKSSLSVVELAKARREQKDVMSEVKGRRSVRGAGSTSGSGHADDVVTPPAGRGAPGRRTRGRKPDLESSVNEMISDMCGKINAIEDLLSAEATKTKTVKPKKRKIGPRCKVGPRDDDDSANIVSELGRYQPIPPLTISLSGGKVGLKQKAVSKEELSAELWKELSRVIPLRHRKPVVVVKRLSLRSLYLSRTERPGRQSKQERQGVGKGEPPTESPTPPIITPDPAVPERTAPSPVTFNRDDNLRTYGRQAGGADTQAVLEDDEDIEIMDDDDDGLPRKKRRTRPIPAAIVSRVMSVSTAPAPSHIPPGGNAGRRGRRPHQKTAARRPSSHGEIHHPPRENASDSEQALRPRRSSLTLEGHVERSPTASSITSLSDVTSHSDVEHGADVTTGRRVKTNSLEFLHDLLSSTFSASRAQAEVKAAVRPEPQRRQNPSRTSAVRGTAPDVRGVTPDVKGVAPDVPSPEASPDQSRIPRLVLRRDSVSNSWSARSSSERSFPEPPQATSSPVHPPSRRPEGSSQTGDVSGAPPSLDSTSEDGDADQMSLSSAEDIFSPGFRGKDSTGHTSGSKNQSDDLLHKDSSKSEEFHYSDVTDDDNDDDTQPELPRRGEHVIDHMTIDTISITESFSGKDVSARADPEEDGTGRPTVSEPLQVTIPPQPPVSSGAAAVVTMVTGVSPGELSQAVDGSLDIKSPLLEDMLPHLKTSNHGNTSQPADRGFSDNQKADKNINQVTDSPPSTKQCSVPVSNAQQCLVTPSGTQQCSVTTTGTQQCSVTTTGTQQCSVTTTGTQQCSVTTTGTQQCSVTATTAVVPTTLETALDTEGSQESCDLEFPDVGFSPGGCREEEGEGRSGEEAVLAPQDTTRCEVNSMKSTLVPEETVDVHKDNSGNQVKEIAPQNYQDKEPVSTLEELPNDKDKPETRGENITQTPEEPDGSVRDHIVPGTGDIVEGPVQQVEQPLVEDEVFRETGTTDVFPQPESRPPTDSNTSESEIDAAVQSIENLTREPPAAEPPAAPRTTYPRTYPPYPRAYPPPRPFVPDDELQAAVASIEPVFELPPPTPEVSTPDVITGSDVIPKRDVSDQLHSEVSSFSHDAIDCTISDVMKNTPPSVSTVTDDDIMTPDFMSDSFTSGPPSEEPCDFRPVVPRASCGKMYPANRTDIKMTPEAMSNMCDVIDAVSKGEFPRKKIEDFSLQVVSPPPLQLLPPPQRRSSVTESRATVPNTSTTTQEAKITLPSIRTTLPGMRTTLPGPRSALPGYKQTSQDKQNRDRLLSPLASPTLPQQMSGTYPEFSEQKYQTTEVSPLQSTTELDQAMRAIQYQQDTSLGLNASTPSTSNVNSSIESTPKSIMDLLMSNTSSLGGQSSRMQQETVGSSIEQTGSQSSDSQLQRLIQTLQYQNQRATTSRDGSSHTIQDQRSQTQPFLDFLNRVQNQEPQVSNAQGQGLQASNTYSQGLQNHQLLASSSQQIQGSHLPTQYSAVGPSSQSAPGIMKERTKSSIPPMPGLSQLAFSADSQLSLTSDPVTSDPVSSVCKTLGIETIELSDEEEASYTSRAFFSQGQAVPGVQHSNIFTSTTHATHKDTQPAYSGYRHLETQNSATPYDNHSNHNNNSNLGNQLKSNQYYNSYPTSQSGYGGMYQSSVAVTSSQNVPNAHLSRMSKLVQDKTPEVMYPFGQGQGQAKYPGYNAVPGVYMSQTSFKPGQGHDAYIPRSGGQSYISPPLGQGQNALFKRADGYQDAVTDLQEMFLLENESYRKEVSGTQQQYRPASYPTQGNQGYASVTMATQGYSARSTAQMSTPGNMRMPGQTDNSMFGGQMYNNVSGNHGNHTNHPSHPSMFGHLSTCERKKQTYPNLRKQLNNSQHLGDKTNLPSNNNFYPAQNLQPSSLPGLTSPVSYPGYGRHTGNYGNVPRPGKEEGQAAFGADVIQSLADNKIVLEPVTAESLEETIFGKMPEPVTIVTERNPAHQHPGFQQQYHQQQQHQQHHKQQHQQQQHPYIPSTAPQALSVQQHQRSLQSQLNQTPISSTAQIYTSSSGDLNLTGGVTSSLTSGVTSGVMSGCSVPAPGKPENEMSESAEILSEIWGSAHSPPTTPSDKPPLATNANMVTMSASLITMVTTVPTPITVTAHSTAATANTPISTVTPSNERLMPADMALQLPSMTSQLPDMTSQMPDMKGSHDEAGTSLTSDTSVSSDSLPDIRSIYPCTNRMSGPGSESSGSDHVTGSPPEHEEKALPPIPKLLHRYDDVTQGPEVTGSDRRVSPAVCSVTGSDVDSVISESPDPIPEKPETSTDTTTEGSSTAAPSTTNSGTQLALLRRQRPFSAARPLFLGERAVLTGAGEGTSGEDSSPFPSTVGTVQCNWTRKAPDNTPEVRQVMSDVLNQICHREDNTVTMETMLNNQSPTTITSEDEVSMKDESPLSHGEHLEMNHKDNDNITSSLSTETLVVETEAIDFVVSEVLSDLISRTVALVEEQEASSVDTSTGEGANKSVPSSPRNTEESGDNSKAECSEATESMDTTAGQECDSNMSHGSADSCSVFRVNHTDSGVLSAKADISDPSVEIKEVVSDMVSKIADSITPEADVCSGRLEAGPSVDNMEAALSKSEPVAEERRDRNSADSSVQKSSDAHVDIIGSGRDEESEVILSEFENMSSDSEMSECTSPVAEMVEEAQDTLAANNQEEEGTLDISDGGKGKGEEEVDVSNTKTPGTTTMSSENDGSETPTGLEDEQQASGTEVSGYMDTCDTTVSHQEGKPGSPELPESPVRPKTPESTQNSNTSSTEISDNVKTNEGSLSHAVNNERSPDASVVTMDTDGSVLPATSNDIQPTSEQEDVGSTETSDNEMVIDHTAESTCQTSAIISHIPQQNTSTADPADSLPQQDIGITQGNDREQNVPDPNVLVPGDVIDGVTSDVTFQDNTISDVTSDVTSQDNTISDVTSDVTSQNNDISDVISDVTSQNNDICDVTSDVTSQNDDIMISNDPGEEIPDLQTPNPTDDVDEVDDILQEIDQIIRPVPQEKEDNYLPNADSLSKVDDFEVIPTEDEPETNNMIADVSCAEGPDGMMGDEEIVAGKEEGMNADTDTNLQSPECMVQNELTTSLDTYTQDSPKLSDPDNSDSVHGSDISSQTDTDPKNLEPDASQEDTENSELGDVSQECTDIDLSESQGSADIIERPESQGSVDIIERPESQCSVDIIERPVSQGSVDIIERPESQCSVDIIERPESQCSVDIIERPESQGSVDIIERPKSQCSVDIIERPKSQCSVDIIERPVSQGSVDMEAFLAEAEENIANRVVLTVIDDIISTVIYHLHLRQDKDSVSDMECTESLTKFMDDVTDFTDKEEENNNDLMVVEEILDDMLTCVVQENSSSFCTVDITQSGTDVTLISSSDCEETSQDTVTETEEEHNMDKDTNTARTEETLSTTDQEKEENSQQNMEISSHSEESTNRSATDQGANTNVNENIDQSTEPGMNKQESVVTLEESVDQKESRFDLEERVDQGGTASDTEVRVQYSAENVCENVEELSQDVSAALPMKGVALETGETTSTTTSNAASDSWESRTDVSEDTCLIGAHTAPLTESSHTPEAAEGGAVTTILGDTAIMPVTEDARADDVEPNTESDVEESAIKQNTETIIDPIDEHITQVVTVPPHKLSTEPVTDEPVTHEPVIDDIDSSTGDGAEPSIDSSSEPVVVSSTELINDDAGEPMLDTVTTPFTDYVTQSHIDRDTAPVVESGFQPIREETEDSLRCRTPPTPCQDELFSDGDGADVPAATGAIPITSIRALAVTGTETQDRSPSPTQDASTSPTQDITISQTHDTATSQTHDNSRSPTQDTATSTTHDTATSQAQRDPSMQIPITTDCEGDRKLEGGTERKTTSTTETPHISLESCFEDISSMEDGEIMDSCDETDSIDQAALLQDTGVSTRQADSVGAVATQTHGQTRFDNENTVPGPSPDTTVANIVSEITTTAENCIYSDLSSDEEDLGSLRISSDEDDDIPVGASARENGTCTQEDGISSQEEGESSAESVAREMDAPGEPSSQDEDSASLAAPITIPLLRRSLSRSTSRSRSKSPVRPTSTSRSRSRSPVSSFRSRSPVSSTYNSTSTSVRSSVTKESTPIDTISLTSTSTDVKQAAELPPLESIPRGNIDPAIYHSIIDDRVVAMLLAATPAPANISGISQEEVVSPGDLQQQSAHGDVIEGDDVMDLLFQDNGASSRGCVREEPEANATAVKSNQPTTTIEVSDDVMSQETEIRHKDQHLSPEQQREAREVPLATVTEEATTSADIDNVTSNLEATIVQTETISTTDDQARMLEPGVPQHNNEQYTEGTQADTIQSGQEVIIDASQPGLETAADVTQPGLETVSDVAQPGPEVSTDGNPQDLETGPETVISEESFLVTEDGQYLREGEYIIEGDEGLITEEHIVVPEGSEVLLTENNEVIVTQAGSYIIQEEGEVVIQGAEGEVLVQQGTEGGLMVGEQIPVEEQVVVTEAGEVVINDELGAVLSIPDMSVGGTVAVGDTVSVGDTVAVGDTVSVGDTMAKLPYVTSAGPDGKLFLTRAVEAIVDELAEALVENVVHLLAAEYSSGGRVEQGIPEVGTETEVCNTDPGVPAIDGQEVLHEVEIPLEDGEEEEEEEEEVLTEPERVIVEQLHDGVYHDGATLGGHVLARDAAYTTEVKPKVRRRRRRRCELDPQYDVKLQHVDDVINAVASAGPTDDDNISTYTTTTTSITTQEQQTTDSQVKQNNTKNINLNHIENVSVKLTRIDAKTLANYTQSSSQHTSNTEYSSSVSDSEAFTDASDVDARVTEVTEVTEVIQTMLEEMTRAVSLHLDSMERLENLERQTQNTDTTQNNVVNKQIKRKSGEEDKGSKPKKSRKKRAPNRTYTLEAQYPPHAPVPNQYMAHMWNLPMMQPPVFPGPRALVPSPAGIPCPQVVSTAAQTPVPPRVPSTTVARGSAFNSPALVQALTKNRPGGPKPQPPLPAPPATSPAQEPRYPAPPAVTQEPRYPFQPMINQMTGAHVMPQMPVHIPNHLQHPPQGPPPGQAPLPMGLTSQHQQAQAPLPKSLTSQYQQVQATLPMNLTSHQQPITAPHQQPIIVPVSGSTSQAPPQAAPPPGVPQDTSARRAEAIREWEKKKEELAQLEKMMRSDAAGVKEKFEHFKVELAAVERKLQMVLAEESHNVIASVIQQIPQNQGHQQIPQNQGHQQIPQNQGHQQIPQNQGHQQIPQNQGHQQIPQNQGHQQIPQKQGHQPQVPIQPPAGPLPVPQVQNHPVPQPIPPAQTQGLVLQGPAPLVQDTAGETRVKSKPFTSDNALAKQLAKAQSQQVAPVEKNAAPRRPKDRRSSSTGSSNPSVHPVDAARQAGHLGDVVRPVSNFPPRLPIPSSSLPPNASPARVPAHSPGSTPGKPSPAQGMVPTPGSDRNKSSNSKASQQSMTSQPGMISPGMTSQQNMTSQPGMTFPSGMTSQQNMTSQPGMMSQPSMTLPPGMTSQQNMTSQPGMMSQSGMAFPQGMMSQPGMMMSQPGMMSPMVPPPGMFGMQPMFPRGFPGPMLPPGVMLPGAMPPPGQQPMFHFPPQPEPSTQSKQTGKKNKGQSKKQTGTEPPSSVPVVCAPPRPSPGQTVSQAPPGQGQAPHGQGQAPPGQGQTPVGQGQDQRAAHTTVPSRLTVLMGQPPRAHSKTPMDFNRFYSMSVTAEGKTQQGPADLRGQHPPAPAPQAPQPGPQGARMSEVEHLLKRTTPAGGHSGVQGKETGSVGPPPQQGTGKRPRPSGESQPDAPAQKRLPPSGGPGSLAGRRLSSPTAESAAEVLLQLMNATAAGVEKCQRCPGEVCKGHSVNLPEPGKHALPTANASLIPQGHPKGQTGQPQGHVEPSAATLQALSMAASARLREDNMAVSHGPPADMSRGQQQQRPPADMSRGQQQQRPPVDMSRVQQQQRPPVDMSRVQQQQRPPVDMSRVQQQQRPPADMSRGQQQQRPPADMSRVQQQQRPPPGGFDPEQLHRDMEAAQLMRKQSRKGKQGKGGRARDNQSEVIVVNSPSSVSALNMRNTLGGNPHTQGQGGGSLTQEEIATIATIAPRIAHISCDMCRKSAVYVCSACKMVAYCSTKCQTEGWKKHHKKCNYRS